TGGTRDGVFLSAGGPAAGGALRRAGDLPPADRGRSRTPGPVDSRGRLARADREPERWRDGVPAQSHALQHQQRSAEFPWLEPTGPGWQMLREDGQPMRRHDMPFERVLATGQPVKSVVVGVPVGNGEVHWALFNAYPENNAQGGLRHVVLTFIDITSLKTAQA